MRSPAPVVVAVVALLSAPGALAQTAPHAPSRLAKALKAAKASNAAKDAKDAKDAGKEGTSKGASKDAGDAKSAKAEPAAKASGEHGCATPADGDRALAQALMYAFEPAPEEIRVLAVEDLGLLGDPRALNPLAALVLDASPAVRSAAIRAVRAFAHPRAEELLSNTVRHPRVEEALKIQAMDALLYQRTASARTFLETVRDDRDGRFGSRLQDAAKVLVPRWTPSGAPAKH